MKRLWGSTRNLIGLLICTLLCMAALLIWRTDPPAPPPQTSQQQDTLAQRIAEREETLAPLIAVTQERPLFHASRSPVQAPTPAAPVAAPQPTLALVGILADQEARIALLRLSNSTELYRVGPGGRLAQWEVVTVGPDFVAVRENGGEMVTLSMDAE
ncbi:type II secretion system protein N [Yoonia sp. 2307UL14-13]|uniref:type II secretion system protein N n=1 Tax=Yoonia sp. 2307UL14-13 TaxID=3126506 RepID=UPI00309F1409